MALEEIRRDRIAKIQVLGHSAYPADTRRTHRITEVLKKFGTLSRKAKDVTVAGRMFARREHGGAVFIDLADSEGRIQAYLKRDALGDDFDAFLATTDLGDILEVTGRPFLTKREERTLMVREWRMLAKSLRPLPEKWHGLKDVEERFRRRYLDVLMNPEVRERFLFRSGLVSTLRAFFDRERFVEVETPMLHPIPGGTLARPFVTHHNALETDLYLRIAPELYLKRLLVAGYERVFEIGKCFRNEGIDATHNPEFTMLECYAAFWDEEQMMGLVENLFSELCEKFFTRQAIEQEGKTITFKKPYARITFSELLARYALIPDYDAESRDGLASRARKFGIETAPHESKGKIADEIYKKICRPHLTNPTFLVRHPLEISPLAKKWEDRPTEVRRLQLVVGGLELANGWAEVNDPIDQRERFEEQEQSRRGGEEEAMRLDEDFLEAMEYGMPPSAGLGIGIDRLAMFFTDTKNIREVVLFPTLRPR